jgi:hypothetical protein
VPGRVLGNEPPDRFNLPVMKSGCRFMCVAGEGSSVYDGKNLGFLVNFVSQKKGSECRVTIR